MASIVARVILTLLRKYGVKAAVAALLYFSPEIAEQVIEWVAGRDSELGAALGDEVRRQRAQPVVAAPDVRATAQALFAQLGSSAERPTIDPWAEAEREVQIALDEERRASREPDARLELDHRFPWS